MFNHGIVEKVKVSTGPRKIDHVLARHLTSGLVVFTEGEYQGKIGVPYWENQLFHQTMKQARSGLDFRRYRSEVLIFQVLPDVYASLRQTLHILRGNYGRTFQSGEKQELARALEASQKLHEHILGLRQRTLSQLYKKVQSSVEKIIEQIGTQPRDENKKEALDFAEEIGKVVDSLGRANPSAKVAQLDALKRRLEDRLKKIISIEPKVVGRRQALQTLIEICELRFGAADDFLARLLPNCNYAYFDHHTDLHAKVAFRLEQLAKEIGEISLQPFLYPADLISSEFLAAARLIRAKNLTKAKILLAKSHESLKLRVIRTDLENFITFITTIQFQPSRQLLPAELKRIRNGFDNIQARLSSVNEKGFTKPVCQQALGHLHQARINLKESKALSLNQVKRELVAAAQLL